jgi:hypothetical protein
LPRVPQGGGGETEEDVGVEPEFFAVMSGRRKTSPPCFKSLREEEERPKTVWAFSPNFGGEAGRRRLHREVFKASGRRKKPRIPLNVGGVREEEDAAVVIWTQGRRKGPNVRNLFAVGCVKGDGFDTSAAEA